MQVIIDNYDFWNMSTEKYWSPTKSQDLKALVHNAIYSGDYTLSEKKDGDWRMFIKDNDGNFYLRGRSASVNGGYADKINWVPHIREELKDIPNGTVLIGEVYFPSKPGSRNVTTIMGCLEQKAVARQAHGEKLHYYIFECLAYNGANIMGLPLSERIEILNKNISSRAVKYIEISKYIFDIDKMEDYIGEILCAGGEGVVLKRLDSPYEPGKRTTRKSIKVKKEIEQKIDCFLTGRYKTATRDYKGKEIEDWQFWENLRTGEKLNGKLYDNYCNGDSIEPVSKAYYYGWASSIEIAVLRDKKIIPIGWISNITEEVKSGIAENPADWKGKVVEVSCMMIEKDTFGLRHAKILNWRSDKDWKDCDGYEVFDM